MDKRVLKVLALVTKPRVQTEAAPLILQAAKQMAAETGYRADFESHDSEFYAKKEQRQEEEKEKQKAQEERKEEAKKQDGVEGVCLIAVVLFGVGQERLHRDLLALESQAYFLEGAFGVLEFFVLEDMGNAGTCRCPAISGKSQLLSTGGEAMTRRFQKDFKPVEGLDRLQ
eukprot:s396_g11.t1